MPAWEYNILKVKIVLDLGEYYIKHQEYKLRSSTLYCVNILQVVRYPLSFYTENMIEVRAQSWTRNWRLISLYSSVNSGNVIQ